MGRKSAPCTRPSILDDVEISESSVVARGVVCIGHANRSQHYVRLLLHSFRFSISKRDECIALWKSIHSEHVFEVDVDSAGQRAGPCAPRPCCHLTPSMLTSARNSTIVHFRGYPGLDQSGAGTTRQGSHHHHRSLGSIRRAASAWAVRNHHCGGECTR